MFLETLSVQSVQIYLPFHGWTEAWRLKNGGQYKTDFSFLNRPGEGDAEFMTLQTFYWRISDRQIPDWLFFLVFLFPLLWERKAKSHAQGFH